MKIRTMYNVLLLVQFDACHKCPLDIVNICMLNENVNEEMIYITAPNILMKKFLLFNLTQDTFNSKIWYTINRTYNTHYTLYSLS